MSETNSRIVTQMCDSLLSGDLRNCVAYLSEEVVYHNMPWAPVTGHAGVRKVLEPFIEGADCALKKMDVVHTAANGEVVMNARRELWQRAGVSVELPVAGVFIVRGGLIVRWEDYWDAATMQPLIDVVMG